MQTFSEFARDLWGDSWCMGPASPRKKARYRRIVSQKEYDAAEKAFDIKTYGAPLISLRDAAPDMLAALRSAEIAVEQLCQDQDPANQCWVILGEVRAAITKAEGR
jgi:hypothetical protein